MIIAGFVLTTTEEFMKRFRELQLDDSRQEERSPPERSSRKEDSSPPDRHVSAPGDRFNAIKSSLKELRRGLNEVTAPYNNNNNANERSIAPRDNSNKPKSGSSNSESDSEGSEAAGGGAGGGEGEGEGDEAAGGEKAASALDIMNVKLPCEFCGALIQADDLVQHQSGCRPDLSHFRPVVTLDGMQDEELYIPCEFCAHRLPLELIGEHQERCSRMMSRMFMN